MKRILLCLFLLNAIACGDDDRPMLDGGAGDGGVDGGSDATTGNSGFVDPSCVDGMYAEALPNISGDLSGITFSSLSQYLDEALLVRYPTGQYLVEGGRNSDAIPGEPCDIRFGNGASDPEGVFRSLDTIVHECGHFYDFALNAGSTSSFAIVEGLTLSAPEGDTTSRGGQTFARSYLNTDEFALPACNGGPSESCDFYRDVYLNGDPTDGNFESGDQGFNLLVEEVVQYINSLATAWAFADQMPPGRSTSARDGINTFLWYMGRYLRIARTRAAEFPGAYEHLRDSAEWRTVILTLWGRAFLYLEATQGMANLTTTGDATYDLATDPAVLEEINLIRLAHGCAGL